MGRFGLADRAYAAAAKLEGDTPRLLNNQGHTYMLRGDLKTARAKFQAALRLDPNNQTTLNNIRTALLSVRKTRSTISGSVMQILPNGRSL